MGRLHILLQELELNEPFQCLRFRHEGRTQCGGQWISDFHHYVDNWICHKSNPIADDLHSHPPIAVVSNMGADLGPYNFRHCSGQNTPSPLRLSILRRTCWRDFLSSCAYYSRRMVYEEGAGKESFNLLCFSIRGVHVQWVSPSCVVYWNGWHWRIIWMEMAIHIWWSHHPSYGPMG